MVAINGAKIAHSAIEKRSEIDNRDTQFIQLVSFRSEPTFSDKNILEKFITFLRPDALVDLAQRIIYQPLNLKLEKV